MDDLISREAAIKLAIDLDCESRGIIKESKCREIENRYNMIPAAQPQRMRGRWVHDIAYYDEEGCPCIVSRCDQCGEPNSETNFCPNCGAQMYGGDTK